MKTIEWLLGRTLDATTFLGAVAVFLMMLHVSIDIVVRYVFRITLPGTLISVANYYMVVVTFLCLAFTERRSGHISVEILSERLPPWLQNKTNLLASVLSLVVFAMLTRASFPEAMSKFHRGAFIMEQGTPIPVWPSYFLMPLGTALMCVALGFKILRQLVTRERQTVLDTF